MIVIATESGAGLSPRALLEPLLGAPLLARGIAASLPTQEAVTGVLVVPPELVERAKADVIERFGLDEIDVVIGAGPDRRTGLRAALDALPADVDFVLVHEGARVLSPNGLADRVATAARAGDAAVPAVPLRDVIVAEDGGALVSLDVRPALRIVQGPQCFRVASLKAAIATGDEASEAELVAQLDASVVVVDGDADNLLLRDAADVSRALEVFSRRAVDYAFIYPRDLLPEDPLARALDASETRFASTDARDGTLVGQPPVGTKSDNSST